MDRDSHRFADRVERNGQLSRRGASDAATKMNRGVYRQMNSKLIARLFLGIFAIAGFSQDTIIEPNNSPGEMKEMAEGLADIFLNGVLAQ